jgi:hypothetical protein
VGDVYTAYVSTGIPNIEVYVIVPPATVARLRRLRWALPLLRLPPCSRFASSGPVKGPGARASRTSC